jgi:hypothetical protein
LSGIRSLIESIPLVGNVANRTYSLVP